MFDSLSQKLESTFKRLRSRGTLSEEDIDLALKDIRLALLEADVNYNVCKKFCENVKAKTLGRELKKSLSPGQAVIKYVHDELINAMGKYEPLRFNFAPPVIIMAVGLQGSGKTTSCGKLARYLRDDLKRRPMLVPADVYRPAAIEQLKTIGRTLGIEVFDASTQDKPVDIAKRASEYAAKAGFDTVILDTAGRLQIDAALMNELVEIIEQIEPHEILLVADAMTGQEAVNVAKGFDQCLDIDGIILTKLDGDARGGAALAMREVTGKPIKLIGVGEKLDALEPFRPDRMASRILGMGDVLTFIEKASKQIDFEESKRLQSKLKKNEFTMEDFYAQLQSIKKMGSVTSLLEMIPGMGKAAKGINEDLAEKEFKHIEAIILSMTQKERRDHSIINGSRRRRIADGSGTSVETVNKFLKQFAEMRKIMKKVTKMGPSALSGLSGMLKGNMRPPSLS
ncbi:MAG: signal recognition particle protein [Deltaproteobacteria bacterium]|nr:signal recognition particle protein [Deltaproteobacteria bacterium]